jgi:hypothetical protein
MSIRYVQGEARAVDTDSGEYLKSTFYHRDHPFRGYTVHAADGSEIITANLRQEAIDLSGDGRTGLYNIDVVEIEDRSEGRSSKITSEDAPAAQKLARFIRVFLLDHPGKEASVEIRFDLASGA